MPSQDLDIALNLERSRASGVLDTQKLWDQERGAITQEVTSDNPARHSGCSRNRSSTSSQDAVCRLGLGTVASFKKIQSPDLMAFYKKWYHPNNAIYVIAGNVDPQATIAKVKALYANLPAAKLPARRPVKLGALTPITLRDNSSDPITIDFLAYRVPGYNSPDYFAAEILNDVLNSQRGALFELQASGKALATFAQSVHVPQAGMTPHRLRGAGHHHRRRRRRRHQVGDRWLQEDRPTRRSGRGPPSSAKSRKRSSRSTRSAAWRRRGASRSPSSTARPTKIGRPAEGHPRRRQPRAAHVPGQLHRDGGDRDAERSGRLGVRRREGEDNTIVPTEHKPLPAFARNVLKNLQVPKRPCIRCSRRLRTASTWSSCRRRFEDGRGPR